MKIDDDDLRAAESLMRDYPAETHGLTAHEIARAWSEHSGVMAASWLVPSGGEEVRLVMERVRKDHEFREYLRLKEKFG